MSYYPFNARSLLYRSKIGAAADGETLTLRLLLHHDARCHEAFLRVRRDDTAEILEYPMRGAEDLDDYRFYDCSLSLHEGLYWYSFRYTSDYGEYFVTRTSASLGIVSDGSGGWWQQTVCTADYKTPDWLCGGIIYQIFPDRFCRSGRPKQNVPDDRFLCSDWTRQPEYRQNCGKNALGNDYYGGDLAGIREKLPYLVSLGVTCIYLNPIFEAHSNHRYNTADYLKIDPLLGNDADFETLCADAKKQGISVILDGVFSHTGDDSRYFNRTDRYPTDGAYNNLGSPYHSWYKFNHFPDDYASWWGITTLPETNENDRSFSEFITGENGVLRYWLKKGARGWRLDVADELPDAFLDRVRSAIKTEKPDGYLLGEVWEDATNKISYGARRRFLRGKQLDSVMNYPFADAIVAFVRTGNAAPLYETVCDVMENYPPESIHLLMNHIGTHDTMRILTRLTCTDGQSGDREWQSHQTLSMQEYTHGKQLLRLAATIQYTLPGVPSLYYGDEAGMQGYGDPFCRGTYPWGQEDKELLAFYRGLGTLRKNPVFVNGDFVPLRAQAGVFAFLRVQDGDAVLVAVNRSDRNQALPLPAGYDVLSAFCGSLPEDGEITVVAGDSTVLILGQRDAAQKPKKTNR